jgi:hypothetical protein
MLNNNNHRPDNRNNRSNNNSNRSSSRNNKFNHNNYRSDNRNNSQQRPPLNAPEYFTRQINRCEAELFELRDMSRRIDVDLHFLYKRLDTCGAFYQQLLVVANRDKITWNYYKYQHQKIEMCLTQIKENLDLKNYQRKMQQSREIPNWLRSLATLAEVADIAMSLAGLPPMAGKIYRVFVGIVGWFTGSDYLQLPGGSSKLLPSG